MFNPRATHPTPFEAFDRGCCAARGCFVDSTAALVTPAQPTAAAATKAQRSPAAPSVTAPPARRTRRRPCRPLHPRPRAATHPPSGDPLVDDDGRGVCGDSNRRVFEGSPHPTTPFPGRDQGVRVNNVWGRGCRRDPEPLRPRLAAIARPPPPGPPRRTGPCRRGGGGSGVDAVGADLDPRVVEDLLELLRRHLPRPRRHSHAREGRVGHERPLALNHGQGGVPPPLFGKLSRHSHGMGKIVAWSGLVWCGVVWCARPGTVWGRVRGGRGGVVRGVGCGGEPGRGGHRLLLHEQLGEGVERRPVVQQQPLGLGVGLRPPPPHSTHPHAAAPLSAAPTPSQPRPMRTAASCAGPLLGRVARKRW